LITLKYFIGQPFSRVLGSMCNLSVMHALLLNAYVVGVGDGDKFL